MFVEFASDAINTLKFHQEVEIAGFPYYLKGLVRCNNKRFTCAINSQLGWVYVVDLCDNMIYLPTSNDVYLHYPSGWVFAVYTHIDNKVDRVFRNLPF